MNGYDISGHGAPNADPSADGGADGDAMYVILRLGDGTEVAYRCEKVNVCPNPYGITAVPGLPWRPRTPYVVVDGAELVHIEAAGAARG